jgi:chaperonin GroEL
VEGVAKQAVAKLQDGNSDIRAGINIVLNALEAPARQIAENAGVEARSLLAGSATTSRQPSVSMRRRGVWRHVAGGRP